MYELSAASSTVLHDSNPKVSGTRGGSGPKTAKEDADTVEATIRSQKAFAIVQQYGTACVVSMHWSVLDSYSSTVHLTYVTRGSVRIQLWPKNKFIYEELRKKQSNSHLEVCS
jgi:hypothetical protein